MNSTTISANDMGERRYRAYETAIRRGRERRIFRHGLRVAFIGILIGVIGGLIVSQWQFPTWSQEDASVGRVIDKDRPHPGYLVARLKPPPMPAP